MQRVSSTEKKELTLTGRTGCLDMHRIPETFYLRGLRLPVPYPDGRPTPGEVLCLFYLEGS